MVVALARCTRPKLKIMFDMALGRRKAAETTPPTFCAFEQVGPEALALVERCVGEREAGQAQYLWCCVLMIVRCQASDPGCLEPCDVLAPPSLLLTPALVLPWYLAGTAGTTGPASCTCRRQTQPRCTRPVSQSASRAPSPSVLPMCFCCTCSGKLQAQERIATQLDPH
jgi:hypothetical protein